MMEASCAPATLLMIGGHAEIHGGLEAFATRAQNCLGIVQHCHSETPGRRLKGLGAYLAALGHCARRLAGCDTVWLHYGSAYDLAYLLLAKLAGKTVVVTPHLGSGWRSLKSAPIRALCNRLLAAADAVFTLYEDQARELRFPPCVVRRCRRMPTFLPEDALVCEAAVRRPNGPLRLTHVARLSAAKGSFAFLAVCQALRRHGVALEASIAGSADAATVRHLREEIAARDLPIRILGYLPPPQLMAHLRTQDVLVNLSLQDAYPLTVLEALACGVAPVCTALPGTREMAAAVPGITLIEGQDGEGAAEEILKLERENIADGRRVVRRLFGWPQLKAQYLPVFAALAAARNFRGNPEKAIAQ